MVYALRVSLSGIKGFFRLYHVHGDTTLYTFHRQLRADLEFPQDQLIMFKALTADGGVVGRYGLFDLGSGTCDQVTLAAVLKQGAVQFVYFYDVTNRKSVNITLEGEVEASSATAASPILVEVKGPNPIEFENGYVAFEDLPAKERHLPGEGEDEDFDDEDEDEDEEPEDDDEEGKEIYDENE